MSAKDAAVWTLRILAREVERFRQASEDPSAETLSIDNLLTVIERTLTEIEAMPT